jgi:hypothetical protein
MEYEVYFLFKIMDHPTKIFFKNRRRHRTNRRLHQINQVI